ncbi:Double-strand break repair protein mus-23 [Talaromyces atroroseus]|uniref:Double-strand break repair protein n=1 Tax=Talaromyces atroroseus TaxID=1441469 RepID=A0A225AE60_TALAT|nr:Double-strand break repair protein mus-23 [Talaromyces atroroseus]OKL59521.1 Double-strand break repair protein mus-23 [Talaromyces atroroseus]
MPPLGDADTIRILVATDNHVGYNERDPVRGDDSWKSFHEIMCLAKVRDVDMVLLAGDLFHENKPSRKSMYQVMRSLRMNCLGDKPCELELLSDASENFQGAFNHVNYEDLDINIAIPVFSIHGNHDDPSGEGHLAALDILQVSGLLNYYGRTPESDNIQVKPVLLQKGRTKLALYGLSNVRDERLFRTFRDGKVKFFQPSVQKEDWFNLICVHQNHHAHTETGYLPENFLPEFLDLVIWGHEHECMIDPRQNPETKFHVMQPGSSVATSLAPGEAVTKQVAILSITGREFESEPIPLKTVRPFIMKELVLSEDKNAKKLARKENNRTEVTRLLMSYVEDLIEDAKAQWLEAHRDDIGDDDEPNIPLPLVRLRVETSTPEGGSFDCENPQRFSNRFVGKVANVNDVVQFHRKKKATTTRKADNLATETAMSHLSSLDTVKVEQLVRELLTAQSLTILPQNLFGDAVSQFVDKDDKHAMEMFVNESLDSQIKHLMALERDADLEDEDEVHQSLRNAMEKYRGQMEELFSKGTVRRTRGQKRFKPKPDGWDSEFDGLWEDQPGALIHSDNEGGDPHEEDLAEDGTERGTASSRGRGRGRRGAASSTTRKSATSTTSAKKPATSRGGRGKKAVIDDEDEDEDEDVIMANDSMEEHEAIESDNDDSQALFVQQQRTNKPSRSTRQPAVASVTTGSRSRTKKDASPAPSSVTAAASSTRRGGRGGARSTQQTTLNFASQASSTGVARRNAARTARAGFTELSDVDDDDDDDAFEPAVAISTRKRR